MHVQDVMTPNPVTISPEANLKTAMERMGRLYRRLPVVDGDGHLVGIVTDRDLRLAVNSPYILRERWQDEQLLTNTFVENCMTANPASITTDTPLVDAIDTLLKGRFSGLPVVDAEHKVIGILTVTDVMRAFQTILTEQPQNIEE